MPHEVGEDMVESLLGDLLGELAERRRQSEVAARRAKTLRRYIELRGQCEEDMRELDVRGEKYQVLHGCVVDYTSRIASLIRRLGDT